MNLKIFTIFININGVSENPLKSSEKIKFKFKMDVKIIKPYKQVDNYGTHEASLLIDGEEVVLREDIANCIRYIKINNEFHELDNVEQTPIVKKVIELLNEQPLDEFDEFQF